MAKLTREERIKIYEKRRNGLTIRQISQEYGVADKNIDYLVQLINHHGQGICSGIVNIY